MHKTDTICAIASAMTNAGIGIIRVSGEDAIAKVDQIYKGKHKLTEVESHTVQYGHIIFEDQIVDEVMILVLKAPRSYTTEDTIEIDCHGGTLVMQQILRAVIAQGVRPAEPGEFTKRAFLNGRIDLSQAESVMDVISSNSTLALHNSMHQLQGVFSNQIKDMRSKIIYEIAFIESALDDPEHISLDGYPQKLLEIVEKEKKSIEELLKTSADGKIIREGIETVIVGKPNAGKSSLLNLLVGENKAIVTDIEGTTRDILEEYITLHGITLKIVDTAGIRETQDIVEKIGVSRAREAARDADLILYVVDSSTPLDENDEEIIEMLRNRKAIVLYNKTDLAPAVSIEALEKKLSHSVIPVSAKEETGIAQLAETIKSMFFSGKISFNDEVYITNARHKEALEEAAESLKMVQRSIEDGMPEDFFSIDLMAAYASLGRIIGEEVGEDLVNEIFSKFCMGK